MSTDSPRLTHLDDAGAARMVDVGDKAVTSRTAVAEARVRMRPETLALIAAGRMPKGDVFAVARELHQSGCRTGILSNTEKPARPLMDGKPYRIFDPLVLSWQAGASKPQRRIFEVLIETMALAPEEILLVDDVEANIAAARDLGLQGLLFTDAQTLRKDLAPLLR